MFAYSQVWDGLWRKKGKRRKRRNLLEKGFGEGVQFFLNFKWVIVLLGQGQIFLREVHRSLHIYGHFC